jgi:hypothetical protein
MVAEGQSSRRAFLALLAGAGAGVLTACQAGATARPSSTRSSSGLSGQGQTAGSTPSASAPTPSTGTGQDLPAGRPWVAQPGEVEPQVKAVATGVVRACASWAAGGAGLAAARRRVARLGQNPDVVSAFAPLTGTEVAASCRIVDAQYGGILATTSSVLVVLDQWRLGSDGVVRPGGTTVDVRLALTGGRWLVVAAYPAHPGAELPQPPTLARQVLANDRIRLPYAARADLATGAIASSVMEQLLAMADRWVVDVSVVRSGHPFYVFGTSRPSDHPKGRAVDVWALDGKALVRPVNHGLAVDGMRLAVARGAYNVGGPVLLSGPQYFSDRTHQDHIHLGFSG